MDRLVFRPAARGGIEIRRIREEGKPPIGYAAYPFLLQRHYAAAAKDLGLKLVDVVFYVDQHRDHGVNEIVLGEAKMTEYRVREQTAEVASAIVFRDFDSALAGAIALPNSVIEWEDRDACCVVDVDGVVAEWEAFVQPLAPRPCYWWTSRSGGLRLVYKAAEQYSAEDFAAVASYAVSLRHPLASIELKTRTRRPPGEHHVLTPDTNLGTLFSAMFASTSESVDVQVWLESRGLIVGQRFPHTCCPLHPSDRALNNTGPVVVYDDHIFCHVCAADGECFGSRQPGYFPLSRLCGTRTQSLFKRCVDGFTHWGHARYIALDALGVNEPRARVIYRAALRKRHGPDPRVGTVFSAGEPVGLVRYDGHWGTHNGEPLRLQKDSPILGALPAAQVVVDGEAKASPASVEWLRQGADLSSIGYAALNTIWGMQITAFQDIPQADVFTILHHPALRSDDMKWRRPKYVAAGNRVADPWGILERAFPGLQRPAVELLIAAKGCSEHKAGLPPMLFFAGPTGAGKTATMKLAASICGDRITNVPYNVNADRLRAGVMGAKKKGSFATFDEYLKHAAAARQSPEIAMESLLGFTEDTESHMLYVGPVRIGNLPVCVWADTTLPREIHQHSQIARRLHFAYFPRQMSWESSLAATGIIAPDAIRTHGTQEQVAAANAILSQVIDRFFTESRPTDFADVAKALGFAKVQDSEIALEKGDAIKELFRLVVEAPPLGGADAMRWRGEGWKLVDLGRPADPLVEAWLLIADKDSVASRSIDETDLRKVLGAKTIVRFETRNHGRKVVVRFTNGTHYNGELELDAPISVPDGHRDTERVQPASGWWQSLPPGFNYPTP